MDERNIVLVGFMGTGKSAVGRALARRLSRPYFDTDAWIVRKARMPIPRIFDREGEALFRDLESEAVRLVSRLQAQVVSTGGGILGREENIALLKRNGVLVCLRARPEVILRRTHPWTNRPMLLTAEDPRQAVKRLLAEREPDYARADWSVDTSDRTVPEVVEQICARFECGSMSAERTSTPS